MAVMADPATALPNRVGPRRHGMYLTIGMVILVGTVVLGSVLGVDALRSAGEDRGNILTETGPDQAIVLGPFTLQLGRIPVGFQIVHTGYASSKGVYVDGKLTDGASPASDEGKVVLQHADATASGSSPSSDASSNLTIRAVPASFLSEAGAKQFAGAKAQVATLSDGKRIVISPKTAGNSSRDIVWLASPKVTVSLSGQGVEIAALEQVVSGMTATSSQ